MDLTGLVLVCTALLVLLVNIIVDAIYIVDLRNRVYELERNKSTGVK